MTKLKHELVYKNLSEEYKEQIFELWNSVLNKEEQLKRIDQVILVFKNDDDKIVGVCTVYTDILRPNNKLYYFFRCYVEPNSRSRFFTLKGDSAMIIVRNFLKNYEVSPKPHGFVVVIENPKISPKLMRKFGLNPLPNTQNRVWYENFNE
jgi:hypothetical protein